MFRKKNKEKMSVGTTNESTRKAWLKKTLSDIPDGKKILDAGAGELQYKEYCKHLAYTSQDFAEYNGKGDGKGLQTGSWDNSNLDIISDITDMPIKDEAFDVVMCTEVLEHVPDPAKAIEEMNRVLKLGGLLIITAPFASFTHFAPYHFSNGFNSYYYEHHLTVKHSFEILEMSRNGNFFEYLAQELRRILPIAEQNNINLIQKEKNEILQSSSVILKHLQHLSIHGNSSNEFACLGYHIKARKK